MFFPKLSLDIGDKLFSVVGLFYTFFTSKQGLAIISKTKLPQKQCIFVDIPSIQNAISFQDFLDTLVSQPKEIIGCMGLALSLVNHEIACLQNPVNTLGNLHQINPIVAYLQNLYPISTFSDLKSATLGKLVSIIGYVVRVNHSKQLLTGGMFVCEKCSQTTMVYFEDGIYAPPSVCPTPKYV
jgi:DNA replicative helicase MCM subunit Mcm2 (Cdc46/Mcm family)